MRLDDYITTYCVSVDDFADQIGVHRTSVYRFMKGHAFPRPATLAKILEVTNGKVTANDFVILFQQPLAATG